MTPARMLTASAAIAAGAALLTGCSSAPAEGKNAAAARKSLAALRDEVLAEVSAESPDVQDGTVPCDAAGASGVDWTSYTKFDALDASGMEQAEKLLAGRGYEVTHGNSAEFLASGPDGETITLKRDSLAMFTGCVVG